MMAKESKGHREQTKLLQPANRTSSMNVLARQGQRDEHGFKRPYTC